ncbi:GNAT family N-acetyltransferase [Paraferrimonas sp. SM1919]|uniref:GNAT family N-acetyltransferase n=1 Tax=Paraferrimonas sp. SM1919 TaxID=2662263 RepID=UPI001F09CD2B|nr:GNAT family N-acetyltransferase [Paraferrimonas sp. SM1919]
MQTSDIELAVATTADIEQVLELHFRYQVDSIKEEDKADGFVTTPFTKEQLTALIEQESGLFIAKQDNRVIAYVMAASWRFWSVWPMFAYMIKALPGKQYRGIDITSENSYQYGPICVDKSVRNQGVFEAIFEFALEQMSQRFEVLITFVNKINPRSFAAHSRKARLEVLSEFEYNNNHYHEMCCLTNR